MLAKKPSFSASNDKTLNKLAQLNYQPLHKMKNNIFTKIIIGGLLFTGFYGNAQKTTLKVDVTKTITKIQPTMFGLFFEDINFAADGGLYAEMIKNRSFEFEKPLMGWE